MDEESIKKYEIKNEKKMKKIRKKEKNMKKRKMKKKRVDTFFLYV